jgi:DNA-binding winged helix-turn-helix (wHTH) protein
LIAGKQLNGSAKLTVVFQFGAFEVNEETGELRKHGIRIKLHSQPFKVLLLLLETPGAIVSRNNFSSACGAMAPLSTLSTA